jgi:hypothetical protein
MSKKCGFVYIWFDRRYKRYYIGAHWGSPDDRYICSSIWMKKAYNNRPEDFKRRILKSNISTREEMYDLELYYLNMIKESEIKPSNDFPRYYNLNIKNNEIWHKYDDQIKTIGQKISAAKKGKSIPCSVEKAAAISKAKKEAFANREVELGYKFSPEHRAEMSRAQKSLNRKHTEEWKTTHSKRLKQEWADGIRKSSGPLTEDHRSKISAGLTGFKRDDVSNYRIAHSKQFEITFTNGTKTIINGLKTYARDNNIPYVTLHLSARKDTPIVKYGIQSIQRVKEV